MSKMSEIHAAMQQALNETFPTVSERKRAVMDRLFEAQWEGDKAAEEAAVRELLILEAKEAAGETHDPPF